MKAQTRRGNAVPAKLRRRTHTLTGLAARLGRSYRPGELVEARARMIRVPRRRR